MAILTLLQVFLTEVEIICADQTDVSRCPYHSLVLGIKPRLAIVEDSLAHQLPHWEVSPLFVRKRDRDSGVQHGLFCLFFKFFCKDSFGKIFWGYSSFGKIFRGTDFFKLSETNGFRFKIKVSIKSVLGNPLFLFTIV